MKPETIRKHEDTFKETLRIASSRVFKCDSQIIADGFKIMCLDPGYNSYYYPSPTKKKSICLHLTIGYINSDLATLTTPDSHVSVQYVIDSQGNIYNLFPDEYWSYHLGKNCIGSNAVMSRQCIGIELSNYGPLRQVMSSDGVKFEDIYQKTFTTNPGDVVAADFRGYKYYAKIPAAQAKALRTLLYFLGVRHNIDVTNVKTDLFKSDEEAVNFSGVFSHACVRKDKSDIPPEIMDDILSDPNKEFDVSEEEVEPVETVRSHNALDNTTKTAPEPLIEAVQKTEEKPKKQKTFLDFAIEFIKALFS